MLKVREYLGAGGTPDGLAAEFGIGSYRHPTLPLVGLKYQAHAPRFHPLVRECRGLVLEEGSWEVVAKPFDRFYNPGEVPGDFAAFRWDRSTCQAKEDGSLVIVYPYRGAWQVNSSGGFGHHPASFSKRTWSGLFWATAGLDVARLDPRFTYLFELCSPYTQVVRPYPLALAFLLSLFETATCREATVEEADDEAARLAVRRPERYPFRSMAEVGTFLAAKEAADPTFEGVIIRDDAGARFKIKTRTYLAAHHGEGAGNLFHPARLVPLILAGEIDEAIAYRPEIRQVADGVRADLEAAWDQLRLAWERTWRIEDQKQFAREVLAATPFSGLLFTLRRARGPAQTEAHLRQLWNGNGDQIIKRLYR